MIHIGILGGGQLAQMLLEAATNFDVETSVLEKDAVNLCKDLAIQSIDGSLQDPTVIRQLVESVDITTYEIEHIDIDTLLTLEREGHRFAPSPTILEIIQDKGKQKDFFTKHALPTAPYSIVSGPEHIVKAAEQLVGDKVVIKSCTGGYDGRGVLVLEKVDIPTTDLFSGASVVEQFIPDAVELAVMVARDGQGASVCYPTVEMVFNEHNTLDYQLCPARVDAHVAEQAKQLAKQAIEAFDGVGIFAVELFLTADGTLFLNEIAPRPHNSGHHTIEACVTSQYAQLLRILLGGALGSVELKGPSMMINLLGPADHVGGYTLADDTLVDMPGVHVHLYGKFPSKPNRKLGHVTLMADTEELLMQKRQNIAPLLTLIPSHD